MKNIKLMVIFAVVASMGTILPTVKFPTKNLQRLEFCIATHKNRSNHPYNLQQFAADAGISLTQDQAIQLQKNINDYPLSQDQLDCAQRALAFTKAINPDATDIDSDFLNKVPGCAKYFFGK